jgi:hypothetical protein
MPFQSRDLWVIEVARAGKCLGLTWSQVHTIPVMRNIPGTYSLRGLEQTFGEVHKLVSVRAAE